MFEDEEDHYKTLAGTIVGTPQYMAPEQALGQVEKIGPSADVFSLGVIFYEMLAERRPFQARSVMATLDLVLRQDPEPPSQIRSGLSRELDAICLKCLNKQPENRYSSAEALAEDLEQFLAGAPILHATLTEAGPPAEDRKAAPESVSVLPPRRRAGFWRRFFRF